MVPWPPGVAGTSWSCCALSAVDSSSHSSRRTGHGSPPKGSGGDDGPSHQVGQLGSADPLFTSTTLLSPHREPPPMRMVLWGDSLVSVPLMVDSGTDNSFINVTLARQAGLPIMELPERRTIHYLNGCIRSRATHRTISLRLLIAGNHREQIQFYLIPSSASSVVLGFPWLATHNRLIGQQARSQLGTRRVIHAACALSFHPHLWTFPPFFRQWTCRRVRRSTTTRGGVLQAAGTLSSPTPSIRPRDRPATRRPTPVQPPLPPLQTGTRATVFSSWGGFLLREEKGRNPLPMY